ncbi:hypothetical protein U9M48_016163 [Paspalum notatum var. saurae]|uniref:Uncharacterized protein n=1 Tax=Paspalum notatum var. saurae TaxID=547442 RepID=A0AAQ3T5V0_PASNO
MQGPNQSRFFLLARVVLLRRARHPVPCGGDMATPGDLSDDEKRAMRGSKFAPLPPPPPSSRPQPRMAHPGGPLTTNKAAALAKFLERKLQQPDGLDSLNPDLVNLAVKNAKETIKASQGEPSTSGRVVRHVSSFEDGSEDSEEEAKVKGVKRKRETKKVKAHQDDEKQGKKKRKKKKKKKKGKGC